MCGIAGFVKGKASGVEDEGERALVLDRMCSVVTHRGPDDHGVMMSEGVALGMRRLSIIDLAGGNQPMTSDGSATTVIFNGEIYNYRELRRDLEKRGYKFRTQSDTETILHGYEEFGSDCVEHLRGMFAFAIWDASARKLFIARDRVGEKPLYYSMTPRGAFVFGSELKCLLEHPEVEREISPEALDAYLTFGYIPDPLSIFRGIYKLPPGYRLSLVDGKLKIEPYWDFDYSQVSTRRSEEDYAEELYALLDESVRLRLVADVPLGAFLSGGIDSSTVVGLMARALPQPVKTFSIGFREDSYDELKYARVAARHFGTEHYEFIVTPEICDIVDELVWHLDEPFADQSSIPTYWVSKVAREHVKVVLSGDGGDELFAGYSRYVVDRRRNGFNRIPNFLRQSVMQPLSRLLPHGAWGRNYIYNVAHDQIGRYINSVSIFTDLTKLSLYGHDFHRQLRTSPPATQFREYAESIKTGEPLDSMLYLDSKTYLPGDILTKVDRMSMAASLEVRVPLLDHKLIEAVTGMPAALKMKGFETKHIFKRAVRELVPDEILQRQKQGFGVPMQLWINNQLSERIRDTLTDTRSQQRGYFKSSYVNTLLDEHRRGRRDHSPELWALMMLELWHRAFVDGGRTSSYKESWSRPLPAVAEEVAGIHN